MSASGYTPIILYNSQTASNTPTGANLALGELAINTTDGVLYYKTTGGTVTPLAKASVIGGNFTNIVVSSTSQLGTVTAGTWNGTAIGVGYGGTGLTSTPTNGQLDIGNGTGFTRATLTAGTGVSIVNTSGGIQISATGTGGGTVTSVTGSGGTTGLTLTGGPITTTGTLTIGGTLGTGAGGTGVTGTPANGQILIGNGSGFSLNSLTAGSNITITPGAGTITISSTGGSGGVTSLTAGTGISVSSSTGAVTVSNTGVTSVNSSTGAIANVAITSASQTFSGSNTFSGNNVFSGATAFGASSTWVSPIIAYTYSSSASVIGYGSYVPGANTNAFAAVINNSGSNYASFYYGSPSSYNFTGSISPNGTTGVNYNITSDRRLKTNIVEYSNSGAVIDAMKPRSFTWVSTGVNDTGFIADEVQAVLPSAVTGQPDAVDENGNPKYQMLDVSTSEMMANIIAELQSLRKRVATLEAK